jgi:hypothetical protein
VDMLPAAAGGVAPTQGVAASIEGYDFLSSVR